MTWPWHVLWWLYVLALGANALLLLLHAGRKAATAEELIGVRIMNIVSAGFMVWFLATYAPPWATP